MNKLLLIQTFWLVTSYLKNYKINTTNTDKETIQNNVYGTSFENKNTYLFVSDSVLKIF